MSYDDIVKKWWAGRFPDADPPKWNSTITSADAADLLRWHEHEAYAIHRAERLQVALQEISEPIPFMRKRAEAEGCKLNGRMAVTLSDDANFLKSIAREALKEPDAEPSGQTEGCPK